jgi:KaiC/GvpD/RAD55 family RecA-like ATPase
MNRVKTGISGLDNVLEGFPKGRTILLTGNAGSGKTIFGLQFANESCNQGLKTIYLATEENMFDLELQASSFGWKFDQYKKTGLFELVELTGSRLKEIEAAASIRIEDKKGDFMGLLDMVRSDAKVLIIDSLGSHTTNLTPREFKDRLDLLVHNCNSRGITTMFILDSATSKEYNDLALFSVYGAIVLMKRENPYTGRRERVMDIVKMRNTMTPIQLLTFDIGKNGIIITTNEDKMDAIQ